MPNIIGGKEVCRMAGPRQPINLIVHNGKKHLTKKEIEERKSKEIQAKSDSIEPPSFLSNDDLKEAFNRYAFELKSIGIISNLDCGVLGRHVVYEHQWEKVTSNLITNEVDENYIEMVKLQERLHKMAYQTANSLGLNISSRVKLVIPKTEEKPKTEFEKKFGDL